MPEFVARGLREFDRFWQSQPQVQRPPAAASLRCYGERRERCCVVFRARDLAGSIGVEDDLDCDAAALRSH